MDFVWPTEFCEYMLKKYGDNHWWEFDDLALVAHYQIRERRLAVPFSTFHKGMELLLGRPVYLHEFVSPWLLIAEEEYRGTSS